MGKSHQSGWIVLRGKRWYGYYRKQVIDPTTDNVRVSTVPVRLGLKTQMTKLAARERLRVEIAKQTGKVADSRILKDGMSHSSGLFGTATSRFARGIGGLRRQRRRRLKSRSI
jgi:hypothetical protein